MANDDKKTSNQMNCEKINGIINGKFAEGEKIIHIKTPTNFNIPIFHCDAKHCSLVRYENIIKTPKENKSVILKILLILISFLQAILKVFLPFIILDKTFTAVDELMSLLSTRDNKNSRQIIKEDYEALLNCVKIYKKPCNKQKRIKKYIVFVLNNKRDETTICTINDIIFFVENNYIADTGIIIISNNHLNIENEPIELKFDEIFDEEAEFTNKFRYDIYRNLKNNEYAEATTLINKYINDRKINSAETLNIIMKSLSYCSLYLTYTDFCNLLGNNMIEEPSEQVNLCKELDFIDFTDENKIYLKFCYKYLYKYYYNISNYPEQFKKIAKSLMQILKSRNEYFALANLSEKINDAKDVVCDYIKAYMYEKYILANDSKECLNKIASYYSVDIANSFILLVKINSDTSENIQPIKMINIFNNISESNFDNLVKLSFYYLLINPFFKLNIFNKSFLEKYFEECDICKANKSKFKLMFETQILTYIAVIEDEEILKGINKRQNIDYFNDVQTSLDDPYNINWMSLKLMRCANGIYQDNYESALKYMEKGYKLSNDFPFEKVLFEINLCYTFTMLGEYEKARDISSVTNKLLLKNNSAIYFSYYNNYYISYYLNNSITAAELLKNLKKLKEKIDINNSETAEELLHISINEAVCSIILLVEEHEVLNLINDLENKVKDDKYFYFFWEQTIIFFDMIYHNKFLNKKHNTTLLFNNRVSLFDQKYIAIQKYCETNNTFELNDINKFMKNELKNFTSKNDTSFIKIDMFSLIERWYE